MDTISEASEPDLMTPAEAAARLRVKPWFITERCRSGEIRATKPGKSWLIKRDDLEAYIESHFNRPAGEDVA